MGRRTSFAPGTPSWVDVMCADAPVGRRFYAELFGWTPAISAVPEAGEYTTFWLDGAPVAGLGPNPGSPIPDAWVAYISVTDAATTLDVARSHGARPLMAATPVFGEGTMGAFADPSGIVAAVWEPMARIGAGIVNQPNSFVWSELSTPDLDGAVEFYGKVFGWEATGEGEGARVFELGGRPVCGAHTSAPGEFPAWSVWFAVDECDVVAERVVSLGGSIVLPPMVMGFGRGALVADPGGAVFGIGAIDDPAD